MRERVREELGISDNETVVATIANYRPEKGYHDLLRAARQVIDAVPSVRFVAIGHGPLEREIQERHRSLQLGDRFLLLGYREDAVRLLSAGDLFVLASLHEGYPIALLEALALGLPVVATSVGAVREVITDGQEGLIVPAGDFTGLAAAIEKVVQDPQLRRDMAVAVSRHSASFDISEAGHRIEDIYRQLTSGRSRAGTVPSAIRPSALRGTGSSTRADGARDLAGEHPEPPMPKSVARARPLRAVFFLQFPPDRSPGQRFRVEQWLHLQPPGAVDIDIRPLFADGAYERLYEPGRALLKAAYSVRGVASRVLDCLTAGGFDVAFLYSQAFQLGPPLLEALLGRQVPVVYDFDDAIFLPASNAINSQVGRLKRPERVGSIVAMSTRTTVGNEFLASYARQFNDHVSVIPTTLDTEKYRPQDRPDRGSSLRIGWSGSFSTAAHLHTIDSALAEVLRWPKTELFVLGVPDFRLHGAKNVIAKRWGIETEIADVSSFDIGIMPLPDTPLSQGKCGFKALLYMSFGIPCVVSPVGVNCDIVRDGENGLVASTTEEWVEAIGRLADDPGFRKRLGEAGRQTVVERFSGRRWAPRFLEVLQEAADSR
jgi:glycosyltransferase involved in cell wall biosynthesis